MFCNPSRRPPPPALLPSHPPNSRPRAPAAPGGASARPPVPPLAGGGALRPRNSPQGGVSCVEKGKKRENTPPPELLPQPPRRPFSARGPARRGARAPHHVRGPCARSPACGGGFAAAHDAARGWTSRRRARGSRPKPPPWGCRAPAARAVTSSCFCRTRICTSAPHSIRPPFPLFPLVRAAGATRAAPLRNPVGVPCRPSAAAAPRGHFFARRRLKKRGHAVPAGHEATPRGPAPGSTNARRSAGLTTCEPSPVAGPAARSGRTAAAAARHGHEAAWLRRAPNDRRGSVPSMEHVGRARSRA